MRAGRLRHLVEAQEPIESDDAYGEQDIVWNTFKTVHGAVEPLAGKEYFKAISEHSEVTTRITLRYFEGLTTKHRIKFGEQIYNIISVINYKNRNVEYIVMAKEDTTG